MNQVWLYLVLIAHDLLDQSEHRRTDSAKPVPNSPRAAKCHRPAKSTITPLLNDPGQSLWARMDRVVGG